MFDIQQKIKLQADSGDFLVNFEAPNLSLVTTHSQVKKWRNIFSSNILFASQVGNVNTNNIGSKISADLLEDSDEVGQPPKICV